MWHSEKRQRALERRIQAEKVRSDSGRIGGFHFICINCTQLNPDLQIHLNPFTMISYRHTLLGLFMLFPFWTFATDSHTDSLPPERKDRAIFFSVDTYDHPDGWVDLRNPISDAEFIAAELSDSYGFDTLIYRNPSLKEIKQALREMLLQDFHPEDQLMLYFSGHGYYDSLTTFGYFVPADGKPFDEDPDGSSFLQLQNLGVYANRNRCPHILLVIDACHSGTFDREIALQKGWRRANPTGGDLEPYIRQSLKYKSRLVITSVGNEVSPDGDRFSPMTKGFLQALRGSDRLDGLLTFPELTSVLTNTWPKIRVREFGDHEPGGSFFFFRPDIYTSPLTAEMVEIKGGGFKMGCYVDIDPQCFEEEKPLHRVSVSSFWLARNEVTRGSFREFVSQTGYRTTAERMGTASWREPGYPQEDNHPVVQVSWYDAVFYCNWRSGMEGLEPFYQIDTIRKDSANLDPDDPFGWVVRPNWESPGYRLPTEAEWEFAARSRGKKRKYAWGDTPFANLKNPENADAVSVVAMIYGEVDTFCFTAPVNIYQQGELGLFDMTGNVWEWCWDWFAPGYYANSNRASDPVGPPQGQYRVLRGGSWDSTPDRLRVAKRGRGRPVDRNSFLGFRLARSVK